MKIVRQLAVIFLFTNLVCHAQEFTEEGWFRVLREPDASNEIEATPNSGNEGGGSGGGYGLESLVSPPAIAEAITPEIQALARGLENDPKNIFDYVHDHIRYVHYFGSKKGAQLTLLERSGNDFDQCALLVSMLRSAGHTASYQFGTTYMPYEDPYFDEDYVHWIGATKPNTNWNETKAFVSGLHSVRGFPYFNTFGGDTNDLIFHRIWVKLTLNGTNYLLDPAFKVQYPVSGINLASAMGLDTNQLMTAAGGTSTADYVQSLSEPSLRNKLRDYTTNLLGYLQSNYPNASVKEIIGGQDTVSSTSHYLTYPLAFTIYNNGGAWPIQNWDYIPTNFMSTLKITVDGTTNSFILMPQLQGQRLSLTFDTNGLAQLWADDDLLLQKQTSGGSTVNVTLAVDHPHGTWNFVTNTLINTNWNDQTVTKSYQRTNASYVLTYAFDPGQEWLRQRQEKLDSYRKQGLANTSREVVTETLNVMGLNWMLQTERLTPVLAAQQEMLLQHHHRFGRMAQEFGQGYYVDVYAQLSGIYPASGTNGLPRSDRVFDLENYYWSAAEHGLIEQLQSSNLVAASTIKMLQIGNTNGQRTYLAKSSNWASIQASLSNYDNNFLKTNYIDKGYSLLLPANGSNQLAGSGSWWGYGLAARLATTTNYSMTMLISGGYHGGFVGSSDATVNPPAIVQNNISQPDAFAAYSALVGSAFAADPVSMADGSFHVSTTDMTVGQAEPRGLALTRYYSSSRRNHNLAGMANGWVHNYYLNAADVSAPLAEMGDTTPAQMAPLIVATKSAFELYGTTGTPKTWAVTSLIAKWGVDQLINNAVSVVMGDDIIQFIKQPNGSFTPPAKSSMTLLKTNGVYWVQERHGNTFKFGSTGFLTNIMDQYNQSLTIGYDSSNRVQTVTDWKSRALTLTYSGTPQRLASVADNTGRTVSYGYTTTAGQLDLTSVTDPENKTSTFLYDTNHQIIVTKDALNRMVVSNRFDGFGRVIEQYSQGDTNQTWQLFWSGFLNTEQNPAGGKRRFYYDEKQRLNILEDAFGNWNQAFYDGQDHVVLTVSPLYAVTSYTYDGRQNLLSINDPLSYEKKFFYDAQDNLIRTVDANANTNQFGYNAKFQLTGSTNATGDFVAFAYNATDGTLTGRTDPGGTTTYGYDSYGQLNLTTYPGGLGGGGLLNSTLGDVLSLTNARGFVTSFQYNQRRELTNTIAPTNITAKVAYDAVGNLQSVTDPRGFTLSNTWSATRKLLVRTLPTTPQGVPVTTNVYDNRDWLARTLNPLQQTTIFTNDAAQRLTSVTDPLQRTTRFGYDDDSRKIATTNAANEVTRQFWNDRSELTKSVDGASNTVLHSYDPAGNQVTLTNRNGKKWQFRFDAANRLTNTITPLGRETRITYDSRGLVSTVREPSTQTTTSFYDAKGRMTNSTDAVATRLFRYDSNNNVTNIVENGKTNAWTFDAYDQVQSYKDADGNLIQYRYDLSGNLTNLIYPGNRVVAYAYDSLNRLTNVTDWANRKTTISYDLANKVTSIVRPNGTVRTNSYDAAGQTTNIWERLSDGTPIALFRLNWNNAARVEWEFAAPLPHAYTPPTRTMTVDDDNRIALFNGNSVVYDTDGNLTSGPLTNNTFSTYTYDARNRLLSAGGLQYGYDPAGNRVAITNGASVTRLVVNPNAALSQVLMRVRSGVTNYYIYGLGLQYEITETATSTNTAAYHYDFRGSTVALTDSNGNVTDRIEYSPYATTTYRSGTNDTPFLYNGRYGVQTDLNGLLCMRARFYNPYLCRFLNADPSGFFGGLNFYAYADGNPVSFIDPFGLGTTEPDSSWLRAERNQGAPCVMCHGVSAFGYNGDPTSFSSYLPGNGPNVREGYEFFHNVSVDLTILAGTYITGGLLSPAMAARLEMEAAKEESMMYHYTRAEESSFKNGLREGSSVTDKLYTNPFQASQELGIPVPNKVIPIQNAGQFVPAKPAIVQPSFRFQGGGNDFNNLQRVPPSQLLPAQPIVPR